MQKALISADKLPFGNPTNRTSRFDLPDIQNEILLNLG